MKRCGCQRARRRDQLGMPAIAAERTHARDHRGDRRAGGERAVQERGDVGVEVCELGAPADRADEGRQRERRRPQHERLCRRGEAAGAAHGHPDEQERGRHDDRERREVPQDVAERGVEPIHVEVVRAMDLRDVGPEPAVGRMVQDPAPAQADQARHRGVGRRPSPVDDEDDQAAERDIEDAGLLAEERERHQRAAGGDLAVADDAVVGRSPERQAGDPGGDHEQEERVGAHQVVPAFDVGVERGEQAQGEHDAGRGRAQVALPRARERRERGPGDPAEADDRDHAAEQVRDAERPAEQREQRGVERRVEIRDEVGARRDIDALAGVDAQRVVQHAALHPLEVVRIPDATGDRLDQEVDLVERGERDDDPQDELGGATPREPGARGRRRRAQRHDDRGRQIFGVDRVVHGATSSSATATESSTIFTRAARAFARRLPSNIPAHTM